MKKGFTLIEMAVSVSIIVLLTAALGPALLSGQKQADIDTVSQSVRTGIVDTQSFAFAPEPPAGHYPDLYIFLLNLTSSAYTPGIYGTGVIPAYSYAIIGKQTYPAPAYYWVAKLKTIDVPTTYTVTNDDGTAVTARYFHNADDGTVNVFFKTHFRMLDGMGGCSGVYYEDQTNWPTLCVPGGDYIRVNMTVAGKSKTIRINKMTGETELL